MAIIAGCLAIGLPMVFVMALAPVAPALAQTPPPSCEATLALTQQLLDVIARDRHQAQVEQAVLAVRLKALQAESEQTKITPQKPEKK